MVNGKVDSGTFKQKRIVANGHPAVVRVKKFKADNGVIEAGTLLAKDGNDECVKYNKAFTQNIGTGDDTEKVFSGTLTNLKVQPGSVVVKVNTAAVLTDNGFGGFVGAEGTGVINYKTGEFSISLTTAPANGVAVEISHANKLNGVLTTDIDTAADNVSNVLTHGAAVGESLLVGDAEAAQEDLDALDAIGIYAQ